MGSTFSSRLGNHLKRLRQDRKWSLDRLTELSGVSRATLSRLENAEVSPTTEILGKLCPVYNLTMSRLLAMAEDTFIPVVKRENQTVWEDKAAGFSRRVVSPPGNQMKAELLECNLNADTSLTYDAPPIPGLEHHLLLLDGYLEVTVEGELHQLHAGDCLRYQLFGKTDFRTNKDIPAKYILALV